MLSSKIFLINIGNSHITDDTVFPIIVGHCILVDLPISEYKSEWAIAQIGRRSDQPCFRIIFDYNRQFIASSLNDVILMYMNYYEKNTGKRFLINGYEVFGMFSPILWKILERLFPERKQHTQFGNIIRLKSKAEMPYNFWINSESQSGIFDSCGLFVPSGKNFEDMFNFIKEHDTIYEKMIEGENINV